MKLTKPQKQALQNWVNFWGRLWKTQLQRLWKNENSSLDVLIAEYEESVKILMDLNGKIDLKKIQMRSLRHED